VVTISETLPTNHIESQRAAMAERMRDPKFDRKAVAASQERHIVSGFMPGETICELERETSSKEVYNP
jgi:hypothetical protein